MSQGTSTDPAQPSMMRAGLSILVLLASIVMLAKTVMVPVANPQPTRQSPRTATRVIPTKPSAYRQRLPIRPLGGYRMGSTPIWGVNETKQVWRRMHDEETRDGRIAADDNSQCGVEHVIHEWVPLVVGKPAPSPAFAKKAAKKPTPAPLSFVEAEPQLEFRIVDNVDSNRVDSNRTPENRTRKRKKPSKDATGDVQRIHRRPRVAGIKPLAKDELPQRAVSSLERQPLIMESSDWRMGGKLDEAMQARRQRIQRCLDFYYDRPLINIEDSPWSMMHHMIAWGVDSRIIVRTKDNKTKPVSTIGWLCGNGVCDGHKLLFVENGKIRARVGAGLQGHDGQFLAMLAQTRVSRKQIILVDGSKFTTEDLIREEQLRCMPRTELTFRLIGLSHYLPVDATWTNHRGQKWDLTRLVAEELRQPINGTTCGGTHRLMGYTYSLARRRMEGAPISGPWVKAQQVVSRHQQLAFRMQNRDGSFSSDFFRSAGSWGDMNRKLKTTGHVLEWMLFSLPPERLDDPRILRAVDYITNLLTANRYYDWENGPLGHAVRALALYDERVFGRKPGRRDLEMAKNRPKLTPRRGSSNVRPPQQQPSRAAQNRSPFRAFRRR